MIFKRLHSNGSSVDNNTSANSTSTITTLSSSAPTPSKNKQPKKHHHHQPSPSSLPDELIVDFPQYHRRRQSSSSSRHSRRHSAPPPSDRTVSFANSATCHYFERYPKNYTDVDTIWYKDTDIKEMKSRTKLAAKEMNRRVLSLSISVDDTHHRNTGSDEHHYQDEEESDVQQQEGVVRHNNSSSLTGIARSDTSDLDSCGIENLLSAKIIKKTRRQKVLCRRAVMAEQARQFAEQGGGGGESDDSTSRCVDGNAAGAVVEWDPNRLASVSQKYTEWSTKRAHTIGLLQSRLDSES